VITEPASGGKKETVTVDVCLVAIGRNPFTKDLGLEAIGVKVDAKGRVNVDGEYMTNVAGVRAIGDVITGPMLAHKSEEEGSFNVFNIKELQLSSISSMDTAT
jgi:dihydrolipoamide dehydrogenase